MIGRLACALAVAAGCTVSSELLPRPDGAAADITTRRLSFCPTRIDVYGGLNVQLVGCGGPTLQTAPLEQGTLAVGTAAYDNTLAGRLRAKLADDPDLAAFRDAWQVRSCSDPLQTLPQLVFPLAADECGPESPPMGALDRTCTSTPAEVLVISVDSGDDRCHGGGPGSTRPDDPTTYAQHIAQRLDTLLARRSPRLVLVGPQTEWFPAPVPTGFNDPTHPAGATDPSACGWRRSDWNRAGVEEWRRAHSFPGEAVVVPDLHEEFKSHHPDCCSVLGMSCASRWFSTGSFGPDAVNCEGAGRLVDHWYGHLRDVLLNRYTFDCP